MPRTLAATLNVGPAYAGLEADLEALPFDLAGAPAGAAIVGAFVEHAPGVYVWTTAAGPDGDVVVVFRQISDGEDLTAVIFPEDDPDPVTAAELGAELDAALANRPTTADLIAATGEAATPAEVVAAIDAAQLATAAQVDALPAPLNAAQTRAEAAAAIDAADVATAAQVAAVPAAAAAQVERAGGTLNTLAGVVTALRAAVTDARAAALDRLDVAVSSRASGAQVDALPAPPTANQIRDAVVTQLERAAGPVATILARVDVAVSSRPTLDAMIAAVRADLERAGGPIAGLRAAYTDVRAALIDKLAADFPTVPGIRDAVRGELERPAGPITSLRTVLSDARVALLDLIPGLPASVWDQTLDEHLDDGSTGRSLAIAGGGDIVIDTAALAVATGSVVVAGLTGRDIVIRPPVSTRGELHVVTGDDHVGTRAATWTLAGGVVDPARVIELRLLSPAGGRHTIPVMQAPTVDGNVDLIAAIPSTVTALITGRGWTFWLGAADEPETTLVDGPVIPRVVQR